LDFREDKHLRHLDPWVNPVTGERGKILELPWTNPSGRATAELTALVGSAVTGFLTAG
jgi:hypothetical protein